jgi:S-adenosylmethionine:tRNA ribosyltransferase-isomerase
MYTLPEELIAQHPPCERGASRLMVLNRGERTIRHRNFADLPEYLEGGDAIVLNDTRVINARLKGRREPTGGAVELLLLQELGPDSWRVMIRPGRRCRAGNVFTFPGGLAAVVTEEHGMGRARVDFTSPGNTCELVRSAGTIPIPPYIRRESTKADDQRYQTVYATNDGAVAAPTAGLHFTGESLAELERKGLSVEYLTLHVGPGTFQPLREEVLSENTLEEERYFVPARVLETLRSTRSSGGRITAVGTTVTRTLESVDINSREDQSGTTDIFIHPPYSFRNVDILLTNFHLPGSSLISLVGSFAGLDFIMEAYRTAVENRYRFYSYGDAMLIL